MVRADAIVVLGCRILPSGSSSPAAARRAATAAGAFRSGVAPVVITSGGRRWGGRIEARVFADALVAAGVPREAIVEELCSLSTVENAILSAVVLRRLGARRAAIVTCPWHMARALADFRAAGVDALPLPTASVEAPLARQVYRRAREVVCGWLDMRGIERGGLLAESARALGS